MEILVLLIGMAIMGLLMGWVAGRIWPDDLIDTRTLYIISIGTTIVVGLMDWYVIPALGFSDTLKWFGVFLEPPLAALAVVWIVRRSRK